MTDVRALLADAAPAPVVRPDFVALVRAGQRRNLARRIRLGLAALALVAGVGGPAVNAFAPASQPQQLSTDHSTGAAEEDISADDQAPASPPEESSESAIVEDAPARSASGPLTPPDAPASEAAPATTVVKEQNAEGCELTGRTEGGVTAGPFYGYTSGWPTCTYRASAAGGYSAHGTWRIEIRRGSEQLTFTSARDPQCAAVGAIQPGDEVTVTLANDGSDPDERFIRVGPSHHC